MSIATIVSVTNKVFKNSNPAKSGMSIDYEDILETYDISKGIEESFKSDDPTDDGLLQLKFNSNGSLLTIGSHEKISFALSPSNKPPTSNSFKLGEGSLLIFPDDIDMDAYMDALFENETWTEIDNILDAEGYETEKITAVTGVRG